MTSFNLDMSVETDDYKRRLFLSLLYVGDVNITWWTCLMMMMI